MKDTKLNGAIVRLSDLFESGSLQATVAPAEFVDRVADEIVSLRARAEQAEADAVAISLEASEELAAMQKPCTWQETDGGEGWATDCGEMHVIIAGTPVENGYRHCCYCGHSLVERPWTEEVQS